MSTKQNKWSAKRIKELREEYKINQTVLAALLGTDRQQTVSEWECGKWTVSDAWAAKLDSVKTDLAILAIQNHGLGLGYRVAIMDLVHKRLEQHSINMVLKKRSKHGI